jgi:hypothetical protein
MPSSRASYSERYCAYVDILGFRGVIADVEKNRISVDDVYRLLSAVHLPKAPERREADLKYQSISDAVALSAQPNAAGFDAICTAAEELSRMLLRSGYFPRGGITKGQLYHDESMVFGPALVEAYRLEMEVAQYPRILIPRSVASDGATYAGEATHWKTQFDERFIRASDGPYFLHILRNHARRAKALAEKKPLAKASDDPQLIPLIQIGTAVQRRYDEASDNPEHFRKVNWFAHYWNEHIAYWSLKGLEPIGAQPL